MRIERKPWWRRPNAALLAAVGVALLVWGYPWLAHPFLLVRLARATPPARLPVPIAGVARAELADTWGASRGEGRRHEGIDIFAPRGTPVRSTTAGIVLRQGWNRLGGRRVLVLGPGGLCHYYAHLEGYAGLAVGDPVAAGDVLGYVGNSGDAANTPTHLHYGLYTFAGRAVNPFPFLGPVGSAGGRPGLRQPER
jgi:murein DD-endopeptidase MepM/ murein hydrolase activator NlpD